MAGPIDPRLLGVIERLTVPVVLLLVLGTVGFFGTTSVTPLADLFWFIYGGLWVLGLLFVGWYERRLVRTSVVESVDPVEILQARYAAGEVNDETFEHRLDTLLDDHPPRREAGRERLVESEP